MKYMNGRDTARSLRKSRPNLAVVYMSGYTENAFTDQIPDEDGARLLAKPFTTKALLSAVRSALAAHRARTA
jgi:FixJ family two-component response regulator